MLTLTCCHCRAQSKTIPCILTCYQSKYWLKLDYSIHNILAIIIDRGTRVKLPICRSVSFTNEVLKMNHPGGSHSSHYIIINVLLYISTQCEKVTARCLADLQYTWQFIPSSYYQPPSIRLVWFKHQLTSIWDVWEVKIEMWNDILLENLFIHFEKNSAFALSMDLHLTMWWQLQRKTMEMQQGPNVQFVQQVISTFWQVLFKPRQRYICFVKL